MLRFRYAVGTAVLLLYGVGVALTWAGSDVVIPWSLHLGAVGVMGWVFGPAFWAAIGRSGSGQAGDGSGP